MYVVKICKVVVPQCSQHLLTQCLDVVHNAGIRVASQPRFFPSDFFSSTSSDRRVGLGLLWYVWFIVVSPRGSPTHGPVGWC